MNYNEFKKSYENYNKEKLNLIPEKELIIFYKYKSIIESLGWHNNLTKEKFIKADGIVKKNIEGNNDDIFQGNVNLLTKSEKTTVETLSKKIRQQFTSSIIKKVSKLNLMNKLSVSFYNFRPAFIFAGIFLIIYPVYKIYQVINRYLNYSGIVPTSFIKNFIENLIFYIIITTSIIIFVLILFFLTRYLRKKVIKKTNEFFKKFEL